MNAMREENSRIKPTMCRRNDKLILAEGPITIFDEETNDFREEFYFECSYTYCTAPNKNVNVSEYYACPFANDCKYTVHVECFGGNHEEHLAERELNIKKTNEALQAAIAKRPTYINKYYSTVNTITPDGPANAAASAASALS